MARGIQKAEIIQGYNEDDDYGFLTTDRCMHCRRGFEETAEEFGLRIRLGDAEALFHERCVYEMFGTARGDVDPTFERYREGLLERYSA